jgi:hypothetical protein
LESACLNGLPYIKQIPSKITAYPLQPQPGQLQGWGAE